MGFSGGELFLIIVVVLVLFGADKIPELVRSVGKGMNEFKKAADEIKRELSESANDIKQEFTESALDIKKEVLEVTKDVNREVKKVGSEVKSDFSPYEDLTNDDKVPMGPEKDASTASNASDTSMDDTADLPESPKPVSRKKS